MATPLNLVVNHPSTLSAADILGIVNSAIDTDAPVVVQALPLSIGTSSKVSAYVMLGEIGIGIVTQIVQAIAAKHAAKTAEAATTALNAAADTPAE